MLATIFVIRFFPQKIVGKIDWKNGWKICLENLDGKFGWKMLVNGCEIIGEKNRGKQPTPKACHYCKTILLVIVIVLHIC